jgi:hypothetical protein
MKCMMKRMDCQEKNDFDGLNVIPVSAITRTETYRTQEKAKVSKRETKEQFSTSKTTRKTKIEHAQKDRKHDRRKGIHPSLSSILGLYVYDSQIL